MRPYSTRLQNVKRAENRLLMKILRFLAPLLLFAATAFGQITMTQAPGSYTDTSIPVRSGTYNKYVDAPSLTYNSGTNTLTANISGNAATATSSTSTTTATNATNIGITNDTTTNATMFPLWVTANTGNLPAKVTSTKFTFNPSTGTAASTIFSGLLSSAALTLSPVASPAYAAGKLVYDSDNESLTFFNNDSSIGLQIGQEFWMRVRNDTGSTIANGSAVYVSGASGGLPQISLANANSGTTATAIGLTTESILTATSGWVTTQGLVHNLDTSAFSAGARLYLGTTNGTVTATVPTNPNYQVTIGVVLVSNASTGTIAVSPSSGRIAGAIAFTDVANVFIAPQTFTPTARTSGVAPYFQLNIPADTSITAATEGVGYRHSTATRTWATTGTVALQRENYFAGPTYASAGASQTFTDAFTMYLDRPIAGTNAIFTRGHTLGIVDSTSAASSITGGLVVATTLGTAATSVGIGGGNINAGGTLTVGGTSTFTGASTHNNAVTVNGATGTTALTITNTARTSGILPYIKYTIPMDTAQTASTESPGIVGATGTRTWATTGTVGLQREIFFPGPTYASASASQTFTDAFNMYLTPPVAGTNAIFTRGHTLGVVDATSAASSITGGLVVSAAIGTTGTSVGIGGGNVNAGAAVTAPSLVSTATVTLFSSATPTTTTAQMAFDNNAWAASFGAVQVHNGTANTFLVGTEASDTPTNGQFPRWNTGGTITWETVTASPAGSDTQVQFNDAGVTAGDAGLTYNKTTDALTVAGPVTAASFLGSGTTPAAMSLAAGTGSILALPANSAGFAAPTTGGTSYLIKPPATITGGVMVLAAPGTADGVNESALTSVAASTSGNVLTSNGTTWTSAAAAGGSLTATQVGYGSAGNALTGEAAFIYVAATDTLNVGVVTTASDLNYGGNLSGGNAFLTTVELSSGSRLRWASRSRLYSNSDGTLTISDSTEALGASVSLGGIGAISPSIGVGYAVGAGGTVTQATNRTTGVTLNKTTGVITTNNTSLAALTSATFTVTNSAIAINDTIVLSIRSGQTNKETRATVSAVAAGSFDITIMNDATLGAETGAIIINFAVIKGSST